MARPKSFDKQRVLQAAALLFWQQGYEATSMRHLTDATGLTAGSLYNEFGSKLQLFEAALNAYIDFVILARIGQYFTESEDPLSAIRGFIVSSFKNVPAEVKGNACLLINTAAELGQSEAIVAKTLKRGFGAIERGLLEQLNRAKELEQVAPDLDCVQSARQLMFLTSGLLVASRTQSNSRQLEETVDFTLRAFA